jgi:hypothetical protein
MLKSIHSPLTRVTISGLLVFEAIVDSATISFSQSTKKFVNHISSDLINTPKSTIARKSFDTFWLNLNPNEPDRIIDPQFGENMAGRLRRAYRIRVAAPGNAFWGSIWHYVGLGFLAMLFLIFRK